MKKNLIIAYFISVVVADYVGLGISVTVFPSLLLKSGWLKDVSPSGALVTLGLLLGTYPLGQFFGATLFGKLSDFMGRRPVLLTTLIGNVLGFIAAAVSIHNGSLLGLFLGRGIAGIFAGNVAVAQAGMMDISNEKSKSGNLALLNGALGASWIIGPPLGGILANANLVSWFNFTTPFIFEALFLTVITVLTALFFTETLELKSSVRNIPSPTEGLRPIAEGLTNPEMRIPFAIWAVFVAGWWLFESYLPTFLLQAYNFSPEQIGTFLGFMGTTFTVTSLLIVKPLAKTIEPRNMVKWFLGLSGCAVLGLAAASQAWQLYLCIFLFVSSMGFALPGLVTTISNYGPLSRQGETMGSISSVQALMTVTVMMIGGSLFSIHQDITVIGGGVMLILSWIFFVYYFRARIPEMVYGEKS
jgi:DHA1 family tetracycline resistance protein-like MFS transporter